MSDALQNNLWRRVTDALRIRGIESAGSQHGLAAEARNKLGTELVERFLNTYYLERQYGSGNSELSDQQAEALVLEIEKLPQPVAVTPLQPMVPAGVILETAPAPPVAPVADPWTALEEAEAHGGDKVRSSLLDGVRQYFLELRVERQTRRRERARLMAESASAKETEAQARATAQQQENFRRAEEAAERSRNQKKTESEKRRREAEAAEAHANAEKQRLERRRAEEEITVRLIAKQKEEEARERASRSAAEIQTLLQRANALRGQGNPHGAVAILEKLARTQPESAMAWFTIGWHFSRDGNFRRSIRCYQKGLKLDPAHKTALNNLGHDLCRMRRYSEAVQALRRAIALDPEYITAWANLGTALRDKNEYGQAQDALREVVTRKPSDGSSWYWLGVCCAHCGDYRGAVEALERASIIHTDNATLWKKLADSLRKLGRNSEADQAQTRSKDLAAKFWWRQPDSLP